MSREVFNTDTPEEYRDESWYLLYFMLKEFKEPYLPRPLLYGESGNGKTSRAYEMSRMLNLELIEIDTLGLDPDYLAGFPVDSGEGYIDRILIGKSKLISEKPCLILLDMLDLSKDEVRSMLLRFILSKKIGNVEAHRDSAIICTMSPLHECFIKINPVMRSLINRTIPIPINFQGVESPFIQEFISGKNKNNQFNIKLIEMLENICGAPEKVKLPLFEYSELRLRWLHLFINKFAKLKDIYFKDDDMKMRVLSLAVQGFTGRNEEYISDFVKDIYEKISSKGDESFNDIDIEKIFYKKEEIKKCFPNKINRLMFDLVNGRNNTFNLREKKRNNSEFFIPKITKEEKFIVIIFDTSDCMNKYHSLIEKFINVLVQNNKLKLLLHNKDVVSHTYNIDGRLKDNIYSKEETLFVPVWDKALKEKPDIIIAVTDGKNNDHEDFKKLLNSIAGNISIYWFLPTDNKLSMDYPGERLSLDDYNDESEDRYIESIRENFSLDKFENSIMDSIASGKVILTGSLKDWLWPTWTEEVISSIAKRLDTPYEIIDLSQMCAGYFIGLELKDKNKNAEGYLYEKWILPYIEGKAKDQSKKILVFDQIGLTDPYVIYRLNYLIFQSGSLSEIPAKLRSGVNVVLSLGETPLIYTRSNIRVLYKNYSFIPFFPEQH